MRTRSAFTSFSFIGLVGGALLMAGCGGGDGGGNVLSTITVTATEAGFSPSTINLDKAGTYTFHEINNGKSQIALDVEGNGVDKDMNPIDPGKTGDLTVDLNQAGTYAMHSQDDGADRSREIHGSIVVKGS